MLIDFGLIDGLKGELSRQVARNEVIASNIANLDTPGYRARSVRFQDFLYQEAGVMRMKATKPGHFDEDPVEDDYVIIEDRIPGRADGNNVRIEKEMQELTRNNIRYNIAIQFLAKELASIKNAITEGSQRG